MTTRPLPPLTELKPTKRIEIDIVYAQPEHPDNAFKGLYTKQARMLLHPKLAAILITAADYMPTGEKLSVKDGLRTVEAQQGMVDVKTKHAWPDTLVSAPGHGGHPRGCAVDIMRIDSSGSEIDVGTRFDDFDQIDSQGEVLPGNQSGLPRAARINPFLTDTQREAQQQLEIAMIRASLDHGTLVMPLPQEHWDYRFPETVADLPHIIESMGRILNLKLPVNVLSAFSSYEDFITLWNRAFEPHREALEVTFGHIHPPSEEGILFSSSFHPVTDQDLIELDYPPMTDHSDINPT